MNRSLRCVVRARTSGSALALIACSITAAVIAAAPALAAVSPPLSPGEGGSSAVSSEGSSPVVHGEFPAPTQSTPNASPALEGVCYAESGFRNESNVGGWAKSHCAPAEEQQLEVCVEQYYEGKWHSSETCNTSSLNYSIGFTIYTRRSLTCTHGRSFRVWNWFYTPGGHPEITTGFYPSSSGETRC